LPLRLDVEISHLKSEFASPSGRPPLSATKTQQQSAGLVCARKEILLGADYRALRARTTHDPATLAPFWFAAAVSLSCGSLPAANGSAPSLRTQWHPDRHRFRRSAVCSPAAVCLRFGSRRWNPGAWLCSNASCWRGPGTRRIMAPWSRAPRFIPSPTLPLLSLIVLFASLALVFRISENPLRYVIHRRFICTASLPLASQWLWSLWLDVAVVAPLPPKLLLLRLRSLHKP
jgi:hypothetical protein